MIDTGCVSKTRGGETNDVVGCVCSLQFVPGMEDACWQRVKKLEASSAFLWNVGILRSEYVGFAWLEMGLIHAGVPSSRWGVTMDFVCGI